MKNSSIHGQIRAVVRLLSKYNLVLFIVIVAAGLVASIFIFTNIIKSPYADSPTTGSSVTSFDQATINRLTKLDTSSKNSSYNTLPTSRFDPFSE